MPGPGPSPEQDDPPQQDDPPHIGLFSTRPPVLVTAPPRGCGNAERGDTPEEVPPRSREEAQPSRPTGMGASSSFTTGMVAVTIGTEADSSVPSSRTEPSSWRIEGRPGRTGP